MTLQRLSVDSPEILACLESLIPASIGSVSRDGTPNVTWLSIVQRLDEQHIGLSRQFFRKTSENIWGTGRLQLLVINPWSGRQYQLNLEHEASETAGPRFESMRALLDAVASQSGMSRVFKLQALEVCRVTSIEEVPAEPAPVLAPRPAVSLASQHDRISKFTEILNSATDFENAIARCLTGLETCFGYAHSILLLADSSGERLYTVASHGYGASGAGSEVRLGEGYIGVCAERRRPVLASNLARDRAYASGVRFGTTASGHAGDLEREIPLPGLPVVMSQLAVPIIARNELLGVLCLQSERPGAFLSDDEHVASLAANQMALAMVLLRREPVVDTTPWRIAVPPADIPPAVVKHYLVDDSIFIEDEYLIKGVAGKVLWRVLREHSERHRTDFSNKEMRLDQTLELPDINDNLEARLILLRRRLAEKCPFIQIVKTGRGRFRVNVHRPLVLEEAP